MAIKMIKEGKCLHTKYTGKCRRCDCIFEFLDKDIDKTPTGKIYDVYDPMIGTTRFVDQTKMSITCPWCKAMLILGSYLNDSLSKPFKNDAIEILEVLKKEV